MNMYKLRFLRGEWKPNPLMPWLPWIEKGCGVSSGKLSDNLVTNGEVCVFLI